MIEQVTKQDGEVKLQEAYPNAMREATQIGFSLPSVQTVSLGILTLNGQWVKQVVERTLEAGYHELTLEREGLSAGVYFYRLLVGDEQYARRLVVE